ESRACRHWSERAMADGLLDLPAFASAFGRAIHAAGIPVTPERSARFAVALSISAPHTRRGLYWTARTVFVSSKDQLAAFDEAFAAVFDRIIDPGDGRGEKTAPPLRDVRLMAPSARTPLVSPGIPPSGAAPGRSEIREHEPGRDDGGALELAIAAASYEERLAE